MGSWMVDILKVAFALVVIAVVAVCMVAIGGVMVDSRIVMAFREQHTKKNHISSQPTGPPAQPDMSSPYENTTLYHRRQQ